EENKNEKEQSPANDELEDAGQEPSAADEAGELRDRLLRLAAEFDNYKKRTAREIDTAKSLGKAEVMKKMLPTLDEFELAISAINGNAMESAKGIEMVYTNLLDALKSEGLQKLDANGISDPYKHEVVVARESDRAEGTILEVVRSGYVLNGMLIRPASVIVSKGNADVGK
ncbi:MAG: nucleotide exchange factor GrpE, partial [Candidatus Micrarchaeota archaeon]|nr:nucleotide exchange factor GrpE [Candidatus Micrarchaeota archaeon]